MTAEPEHIAISKSKGIKIDWKDNHHSEYGLAYLRDECPCATCTGAHGTEPQKSNYSAPASPFQMYKPTLENAERRTGGQLRHQNRLERRPQHRHLFVRPLPQNLPVRRVRKPPRPVERVTNLGGALRVPARNAGRGTGLEDRIAGSAPRSRDRWRESECLRASTQRAGPRNGEWSHSVMFRML